VLETADEVWGEADLVLKVKEPVPEEFHRLRKDQVLFTYLHLAASREVTEALLDSGTTAVAYETVELADGRLPLLAPMSEVAGRMAPQVGAHLLERESGGRGVLMGGVSGWPRPRCWCWAAAWPARTRPGSPRAWRPRSPCSTRTSTSSATSTRSTRAASSP
jgi:alanine dehydrogenase